jgi:CBS domain-containing protein
MLNVQQILSRKGRAIFHVAPDATVYEALQSMAEHDCGALLVLDGKRAIGVVSERDYARKVVLSGRMSKDTPVRDIMGELVEVSPCSSVATCMAIMTERRTRHLAVCEGAVLVGVISIGDVVKSVIDEQEFTIRPLETYITGSR